MRQSYLVRLLQLTWGLFLGALGSSFTLNASIGFTPWGVFHVGLSKLTSLSIGNIAIITGISSGLLALILGEKLGIGTVFDMVVSGIFLDIIIHIIPKANSFAWGMPMLLTGLIIDALGTYFYMKPGLGAGPRDSLMVAFTRRTGLPIGVCRGAIEVLVVTIGWRLGGMVGIGTIIAAFSIGFCIQTIFKLFKFDATKINHELINQTYRIIFKK